MEQLIDLLVSSVSTFWLVLSFIIAALFLIVVAWSFLIMVPEAVLCEPVVAKKALEGREADALLDGGHGERVPEHVRGDRPAHASTVRHALDHATDRA